MNRIEQTPSSLADRDKEIRETMDYWEEGRDTFEHNGKRVEFYGLAHVPKTLELHREEIEKAIEESAYVISEAPPSITVDKIREFLRGQNNVNAQDAQGNPITVEEALKRGVEENENMQFYREISDIAHTYSKNIVTSDPAAPDSIGGIINVLLSTKTEKKDEEIETLRSIVGGSSVGLALLLFIRAASENKKVSRREFLKMMAAGGALGTGWLGVLDKVGKYLEEEPNHTKILYDRTDTLGFSVYSFRDYRDVCIARGIDVMTKRGESLKPVIVIYGGDHKEPVRHYLENATERELRYKAYAPYRKEFPAPLVEYSPNQPSKEKKWESRRLDMN